MAIIYSMNFRRFFVLLLTHLFLISGCVSIKENYSPQRLDYSVPPLEKETRVSLGEPMISQGTEIWHEAIYLPHDIKLAWGSYTILAGYYTKDGDSETGTFYSPSKYRERGAIISNEFVESVYSIYIPENETKICVIPSLDIPYCRSTKFELTKQRSISNRNFQQHLIYGGGYGNKINIIYRERRFGVVQPDFDHPVEYDLSKSQNIRYKGAQIRVIEATNEWIDYTVVSYFE